MTVQINLSSGGNVSGGSTADALQTSEYSNTAAVLAAVSGGFLSVVSPKALDGTPLKSQLISVTAIKTIVTVA